MKSIFVSAIDTDAGKSIITGALAKQCITKGINAITQKIVQTGVEYLPDDIITHRNMMGIKLVDEDLNKLTCPYLFKTPASPHLAAELEDTEIDVAKILSCTERLKEKYELVILEGAGGLHVPIRRDYHIIDFVEENNFPLVLVATANLGSINHTLLSVDVLKQRNVNCIALVYNTFGQRNEDISEDSFQVICEYAKKQFPNIECLKFPILTKENNKSFPIFDSLIDNYMNQES